MGLSLDSLKKEKELSIKGIFEVQSLLEAKAQSSSLLKFLSCPMILLCNILYEKHKVLRSLPAGQHQNENFISDKSRTDL